MATSQSDAQIAIWFQRDAAFLYKFSMVHRDTNCPSTNWVAVHIQNNAAYSAAKARQLMGIEQ